jgi:beta-lactamase regulating signal transducer with metallopeptidase domain
MNTLLFDGGWIGAGFGAAVAAVIVAALGLAIDRTVRGRPAPLRHGLMLAALVVLGLVPAVAAASRLSGRAAVKIPSAVVDWPVVPGPVGGATVARPQPPLPDTVPASAAAAVPAAPGGSGDDQPASSARPPTFREAASCLLWVWLAGVIWSGALLLRDLVRLRRLKRTLVPCASPAAANLLDDAARAVGLRHPPRLRESAAVPVPVVIGPVGPVVVLPAGMAGRFDRERLAAVLVHEAAHVVQGDLWVGLLQSAVAAVFWWCPPVHRLNRRLAEVREEICDDYVVGVQGDGVRLAEVLVEMAAALQGRRLRLAVGALDPGDDRSVLEGRVERLVNLTTRTIPMTRMTWLAMSMAGAFGVVALGVVLATTIHAADEPAETGPQAVEQREKTAGDHTVGVATETLTDDEYAVAMGMLRDLKDELEALAARANEPGVQERAAMLLARIDSVLVKLAGDNRFPSRMYFVVMSMALGSGKGPGSLVPKDKAQGYLDRAAAAFDGLLEKGGDQAAKFEPSIRLRLARIDRDRGKFDEAQKQIDWILADRKRQAMLDVQVQATELLQAAGTAAAAADPEKADRLLGQATVGRKDGTSVVWGWGGIAEKLASKLDGGGRWAEQYLEARFNIANCLFARAQLPGKAPDGKATLLAEAKQAIAFTRQTQPALGGESSARRFETLLADIQQAQGLPRRGFEELGPPPAP